jgi:hypothetical protein
MDLLGTVACSHDVGIPVVNYTLDTCPRCLGSGSYGGTSFSKDGNVAVVTGVPEVVQDITKILTENMRPSGYGFNYALLSGVIDPSRIDHIRAEAARCINYLINLQAARVRAGATVAANEQLASPVDSVTAYQDTTDPRKVVVSVVCHTVSGQLFSTLTPLQR